MKIEPLQNRNITILDWTRQIILNYDGESKPSIAKGEYPEEMHRARSYQRIDAIIYTKIKFQIFSHPFHKSTSVCICNSCLKPHTSRHLK